jgi:hypothetical protein
MKIMKSKSKYMCLSLAASLLSISQQAYAAQPTVYQLVDIAQQRLELLHAPMRAFPAEVLSVESRIQSSLGSYRKRLEAQVKWVKCEGATNAIMDLLDLNNDRYEDASKAYDGLYWLFVMFLDMRASNVDLSHLITVLKLAAQKSELVYFNSIDVKNNCSQASVEKVCKMISGFHSLLIDRAIYEIAALIEHQMKIHFGKHDRFDRVYIQTVSSPLVAFLNVVDYYISASKVVVCSK